MPKNENEKNVTTPETAETVEAAPAETVMVSDLNLLDDDARMAHTFMSKAVREAEAALTGSESETETLARIFADADDKTKKSEIVALVQKARESVPSEEEVAEILKKARKRYDAGLLAWESEDTPENFFVPEFPKVKGQKSGSGTGRGAGVPRPRGLRAQTPEHTGADTKAGYLTCATLAQKIGNGITTASLLDAWKSAAGEDSEQWNEGQTATVSVKGADGTEYPVTFTYKKG